MNESILNIESEFTVLLQIKDIPGLKFGYWQPGMSIEEFEQWWLNLDSVVPFTYFPKTLPGKLFFVRNDDEFNQLEEISNKGIYYIASIEFNKNSFVRRPDGTNLFHKGKTESDNSQHKLAEGITILLMEEGGYRQWIWQPEMTIDEFEKWWQSLETVYPYFFNPAHLPGKMYFVTTEDQVEQYDQLMDEGVHYSGHIHMDTDSYITRPDGTSIHHRGFGKEVIDDDTRIFI